MIATGFSDPELARLETALREEMKAIVKKHREACAAELAPFTAQLLDMMKRHDSVTWPARDTEIRSETPGGMA